MASMYDDPSTFPVRHLCPTCGQWTTVPEPVEGDLVKIGITFMGRPIYIGSNGSKRIDDFAVGQFEAIFKDEIERRNANCEVHW